MFFESPYILINNQFFFMKICISSTYLAFYLRVPKIVFCTWEVGNSELKVCRCSFLTWIKFGRTILSSRMVIAVLSLCLSACVFHIVSFSSPIFSPYCSRISVHVRLWLLLNCYYITFLVRFKTTHDRRMRYQRMLQSSRLYILFNRESCTSAHAHRWCLVL